MPRSCGNDSLAAKIVCPYFKRLADHIIVCENDGAGEYGRIFRRRDDLRAFACEVCCKKDYALKCSHASSLKKSYES